MSNPKTIHAYIEGETFADGFASGIKTASAALRGHLKHAEENGAPAAFSLLLNQWIEDIEGAELRSVEDVIPPKQSSRGQA